MREIKFRAWDSVQKDWICKDFHIMGEMMMCGVLFDRPVETFNDVIISQFTGVCDKYGKEIYEGDILQYLRGSNTKSNIVEYGDGAFFCGYHEGSSTRKRIKLIQKRTCVVIGNIFENKDRLEGGN